MKGIFLALYLHFSAVIIGNLRNMSINLELMHFFLPEMLVSSASADLTLQDNSKNTALHLACSKVCTHRGDMGSLWSSAVMLQFLFFTTIDRARDHISHDNWHQVLVQKH